MNGTTVLLLASMAFGAFVRGSIGFGNALVAMPLLALLIGPRAATPLVGLNAIFLALVMLRSSWRQVHVQHAWRLLVGAVLGMPLGLLFLKGAEESVVKLALGGVIAGYAVVSLTPVRPAVLRSRCWAFVAGFFSGILGAAYNANGPPVVIYGTCAGWSPERFRATLQGFFLPTGLLIITSHAAAGLWTRQVLGYVLLSIPVTALGLFAGERLARRVSQVVFTRIVNLFLIAVGLMLVYHGLC